MSHKSNNENKENNQGQDIVSKKKKKPNRFSGKANEKLYNFQKQKLTWQVKGLIKNWLSRFRKKDPEKLIYLNSYKSKQKEKHKLLAFYNMWGFLTTGEK